MAIVLKNKKWICCQLGARMHYAVPRFLHAAGQLERLYTDIYAGQSLWARILSTLPARWCPAGLRRFSGRQATGLPKRLIKTYPILGLHYYYRRGRARDLEAADKAHIWAGASFGKKIVRDGFGTATAVYAFNTAALEILAAARQRGLFTVVEQTIVPRSVEESLLAEVQERYAGWELPHRMTPAASSLAQREREEWNLADVIVCGSEFVRQGVGRCGGPVDRCVVLPYGVDSFFKPKIRKSNGGPLRVLTVGQVNLRKGAGCFSEVAAALADCAHFRWVGAVLLQEAARAKLAKHVELTGIVPRHEILKHYEWADVFFLPSVCEGSATVTYEALACGLPVVTTFNAGSVVRDGVNGFLAPVDNPSAMAERLRQLHNDRALLLRISEGVMDHAKDVSLAAYRERFLSTFGPGSGNCDTPDHV